MGPNRSLERTPTGKRLPAGVRSAQTLGVMQIPASNFLSALLLTSVALLGCSKQERDQPHEYIKVVAVHGAKQKTSDISHIALSPNWKKNYFPIGTGACASRLSRIDLREARKHIQAFNAAAQEADFGYKPAIGFTFQCIQYLGFDSECLSSVEAAAKRMPNAELAAMHVLAAGPSCARKSPLGESRSAWLSSAE